MKIGQQDKCELHAQFVSLSQFSQTHPYQYLKQMNAVFNSCNKSTGKHFSSASMVKLPWKQFKTVNIPTCFEENYNAEKRDSGLVNNSEDNELSEEQEKDKKFWKQHNSLMKTYYFNKKQAENKKKQRLSYSNTGETSNFGGGTFYKTKDQSSIYLKKIAGKGCDLRYDQQKFQQEILDKLKYTTRSKTPFRTTSSRFKGVDSNTKQNLFKKCNVANSLENTQKTDHNQIDKQQFLTFDKEEDLIKRYKTKIKQIDCSISDKNVRNTTDILRKMQRMACNDFSDI